MGQTLSYPVTEKRSESGGNGKFLYGVSEMQGWRLGMEDAHATILDLDEGLSDSNTFFAVYDGHGGGTVAKYAGQNVHKRLLKEEAYKQSDYKEALKRAFLGTDEDLLADPAHARETSGCTAVAALVTPDGQIYVANAGDSRSVIGIKGEVKALSDDHKPTNDGERERIYGAGGYVDCGRVNGNLALSRAIGDFEFKKNHSLTPERQIITSDPEVSMHQISSEDEFFVLACDGIWDCLSSQQVVDFVRYQVSQGKELVEIGEMMCEHCLAPDTNSGAGIGCDNMTVLIVAILNGRTKEEWYAWITDRVKNNVGHRTPSTLPQLYAQNRLTMFRSRREAMERIERERAKQQTLDQGLVSGSGLSGFTKILSSTGGISFTPGSAGITSDSGTLLFTDVSGDDEDSEDSEEEATTESVSSDTPGSISPDPTKHLKAKLDQFVKDMEADGDTDEASPGSSPDSSPDSPATSLPNGKLSAPVGQLHSEPFGDEPLPVVKAEGLLDSSEDPVVNA